MIRCGHCGGQHATVAAVRACSAPATTAAPAAEGFATGLFGAGLFDAGPPDARAIGPLDQQASAWAWPVLAGPEALGRNVVVGPGQAAPEPWSAAERLVIDNRTELATILGVLRDRAHRRVRSVLELHLDLEGALDAVEERPPYSLGPGFSFDLEVLHHLVWSNSVDARDPTRPVWPWRDAALTLGATPATEADVTLVDGRPAWVDGGPVRFVDLVDGHPVVHRVSIEHGSLTPFGSNEAPPELAADQAAAVTHLSGGSRVIAPAGSGKTRVLTERARLLRVGWQIPADALTLVAFNKRAQEEMRERTLDVPRLHVRTLNSLALAVVNGEPPFASTGPRRTTIDEGQVRQIIDGLVQFPKRRNVDPVAAWIEALTAVRLGLTTPEAVERSYGGDVDGFAAMFPRYRDALARRGALDFDEQIYAALELLLTNPRARHRAQAACRMLLVDELQDLTPAHVLLLRLLAAPDAAVFGVGDDDQTIYGYNGADPSWLIDFDRWFPGAGDHSLEVNYRCPEEIVTAVDRLLRHNRRRVTKTIRAAHHGGRGWSYETVGAPLATTVAFVDAELAAGRAPSDIAVLTRVNSLLAPVQVALAARGVPLVGGVGAEFLSRTAVRAALAWLRMAADPKSMRPDDVAEAIRRPSRSVRPRIAEWASEQSSPDGLRQLAARLREPRDATVIESFAADIELLAGRAKAGATTAELLDHLNHGVGLGRTIATLDHGRHGMNRAAQGDDLDALAALATLQPDAGRFPRWLQEALRRPASDPAGVTLATVHRVKGQEWPVVVVHHADDQQFPHRLSEDDEEERRVFHVALTRAKEHALVVATSTPTPFLAELLADPPAELLEATRPATVREEPRRVTTSSGSRVERDSPFRKGTVLAVPGQVLADQGQLWQIVSADAGEVRATSASSLGTRVFRLGSAVVTAGGRRGTLQVPTSDDPPPAVAVIDDQLRVARRALAAGKPAYTVVSDATIEAIAVAQPRSLDSLATIKGIGPRKLEDYGDALLAAVAAGVDAAG